jgi:hypothetical protein
MSKWLGGLTLITVFVVASLAVPLSADTSKTFKRTYSPPLYDAAKEVTIEGTIQSVVKKPTPGLMLGAHLMVSTSKGVVDAHIGGFVLQGQHPYSPSVGGTVKLVGVMATVNQKQVFLTRTIESGDATFQVRTEHGYLIMPGTKASLVKASTTGDAR